MWKKRTVEESYRLSIFTLRRKRLLEKETGRWSERKSNGLTSLETEVAINQPMWANTLFVTPRLTDALGREHRFNTTEVRLTSTPCRFGNCRWWFLCPGSRCGRRVAVLYLPPGQIQYLCRHCHELTYEGCQKHRDGLDTARRYGRFRERWEAARTTRQKVESFRKLSQALDALRAYQRAYHRHAMERIARLRKAAGIKGEPDIFSIKL